MCFLVKKKFRSAASSKMILMKSQGLNLEIPYFIWLYVTYSPDKSKLKLESLFQRNLFDVAVSICQHHGLGQNGLSDVYKRWADFLYAKGEHMEAAQKYIQVTFRDSAESNF